MNHRHSAACGTRLAVLLVCLLPAALQGGTVRYTYDAAGRLVRAEYSNGSSVSYSYDSSSNIVATGVQLSSVDLYFPFYQAGPTSYTGFGVSNYSDRAANLQFSAFGPAGSRLVGESNPSNFQLAARRQLAQLGSEIFAANPAAPAAGWVQLTSDNADLGNLFQFGGADQLDGSVAFTQQSRKLYFTRVFEGATAFRGQAATTQLSLANPNMESITVRLSLLGPDGRSAAAPRTESIPSKGMLFRSLAELFGAGLSVSGGYIVADVTSGEGAVGFELVSLPARGTVVGLNASGGETATGLFSAQMANGQQAPEVSFFTEIKLLNTAAEPRTARLRVLGEDGAALAAPVDVTLAAGEVLERDAGTLFGLGAAVSAPLRVGSVRVEADSPGLIGDVLFGDPALFQFAAALPLQTRQFTRAVFSQVANALGFFTGLALYNPGAETAQVTITVFSETGTQSGQAMVSLEAGRRVSRLLSEFVPGSAGQLRGYIVVESTLPLIAQELFGDNRLSFLSAVPPTIIQ